MVPFLQGCAVNVLLCKLYADPSSFGVRESMLLALCVLLAGTRCANIRSIGYGTVDSDSAISELIH